MLRRRAAATASIPEAVYYDVESERRSRPARIAARRGRAPWRRATRRWRAAGSLGSGSRVIGVWRSAALEHPMPAIGHSRRHLPARRRRSRQPRHGPARRAGLRRRRAWSSARERPTRSAPRRCARAWARSSASRVVRATFDEARARAPGGGRSRSCPAPGRRCARSSWPARRCSCSAPSAPACPPELAAACDESAHVPLAAGGAESLNVAMTATLCLYERCRSPVHRLSATDA